MPKKKIYAQSKTQIKDGRIVRINEDVSIKSDLGPYLVKQQGKK